ncbi:hypothetical protein BGW80DRAFT_1330275 [Lactifluus volemus]|nr:hypothetical protein BGW80DRAFT_1330275 [Lactifluus volemus]
MFVRLFILLAAITVTIVHKGTVMFRKARLHLNDTEYSYAVRTIAHFKLFLTICGIDRNYHCYGSSGSVSLAGSPKCVSGCPNRVDNSLCIPLLCAIDVLWRAEHKSQ